MTPERSEQLRAFARSVNLELADSELPLVNQALTHRSYAFEAEIERDNERLEFLGDAVIGLIVSRAVFEEFKDYREGRLSQAKAAVVSRKTLGHRAKEMGLGEVVLFGRGESRNGGPARLSTLGAALEAFVGALYLLRGVDSVSGWILDHILAPSRRELTQGAAEDYKSRLQEYTQAHCGCLPVYKRLRETGPDHCKSFLIEVQINGTPHGRGEGARLKEAEHHAALQALQTLGLYDPSGKRIQPPPAS